MENKQNKKSHNFLKKESFYVILLICLCIVAVVAAITIRNNNKVATNPPVAEDNQLSKNTEDNNIAIEEEAGIEKPDDALLVKKKTITVPKNGKPDGTAAVSSTKKISFVNPVEGTLLHGFDVAFTDKTTGWNIVNHGIDIKAKEEASVLAAADGEVEYVGKELRGFTVVIKHSNGMKTVYSNLQKEVKVKVNDKVKKKQEIAKIGKDSTRVNSEQYGPYLHFEVLKGNKPYKELIKEMDIDKVYVDPAKYVTYKK